MAITTKIRAKLENVLEKIEDTEIIKELGTITAECDQADNDYEELLKKHASLKDDYIAEVKKSVSITKPDDNGKPKESEPVSLEKIANELLEKQKE